MQHLERKCLLAATVALNLTLKIQLGTGNCLARHFPIQVEFFVLSENLPEPMPELAQNARTTRAFTQRA